MAANEELFDILSPTNGFKPTGVTKTAQAAVADGDWVGSFCIWLYTAGGNPSIIYQERSLTGAWAPGKLDCASAGHYSAGEQGLDGLREVREELGIEVEPKDCHFVRRRINVAIDALGRERRSVSNLYVAQYDGEIEDMKLQPEEVEGVVVVPIKDLIAMHRGHIQEVVAQGIKTDGTKFDYRITPDSFVPNYDDLHFDMIKYIAAKTEIDNCYFGS